jgi:hypothetical protein
VKLLDGTRMDFHTPFEVIAGEDDTTMPAHIRELMVLVEAEDQNSGIEISNWRTGPCIFMAIVKRLFYVVFVA